MHYNQADLLIQFTYKVLVYVLIVRQLG